MSVEAPIQFGTALVTGVFRGWSDGGHAIVELNLEEQFVIEARTIAKLGLQDVNEEVLVQFTSDADATPVVMGRLDPGRESANLKVDGREEILEITGEREITLRCGKASITLTRAGKIILRGTYISSRSSGMNRIKGGSVQLN